MAKVQRVMEEAERASSNVLNETDSDDDSDSASSGGGRSHPLPPPAVGEDDLRPLDAAVRKAQAAATTRDKVGTPALAVGWAALG